MTTVCIEYKTYEEWADNPEVQKKIIEENQYINVDDDWMGDDFIKEYWAEKLAELGFDVLDSEYVDKLKYNPETNKYEKSNIRTLRTIYNIAYSGFASQGSGASFTGSVDIVKWIKKNEPVKYKRIASLIRNSILDYSSKIVRDRWHHYVHENTTSLYIDWYPALDHPNLEAVLDQLEKDIYKHHYDLNREIYKDLNDAYDADCSDDAVIDTLIANSYEFNDSGKML